MLLTIDIGNTNLSVGIYDGKNLIFSSRLFTDKRRTADQYAIELKQSCLLKNIDITLIDGAIISSVVPELTETIKNAVKILSDAETLVLGPGIKSGLNIRIDNPAQLGADLVAGAVGAIDKYPLPCLIMDLGTATKISVIDKNGAFRGCTISPGIGISVAALSDKASLLPNINLSINDCCAFGTNTVSSMQAGIILGTASMLDGLCEKIEAALGQKISSYVATGGLSTDIVKYCKNTVITDSDLILDGLRIIYNKNR